MLLSAIVEGKADTADLFFLLGVILFAVATVLAFIVEPVGKYVLGFIAAGLTAVAIAWLVL